VSYSDSAFEGTVVVFLQLKENQLTGIHNITTIAATIHEIHLDDNRIGEVRRSDFEDMAVRAQV
jgi:hypothetical protein